jgi:hypothetical protein
VDLGYFLNQRLNFVEYFHANTTAYFQEVKRKIEAGEPPYAVARDPECTDEPAFLEEWESADAAMNITGAACLDLLQSTLHAFLDAYMAQIGNAQLIPELKQMGEKSWFGNYNKFFEECLHINWAASGADIALLEDAILTRNDFAHNADLQSLNAFQTHTHSKKYPDSAFGDPRWKPLFNERTRSIVPGDTLRQAVGALRTLCEYLERERYATTKR